MTTQQETAPGVPDPEPLVSAVIYADHQLRITHRSGPNLAVVQLIGEIDVTNTTGVAAALARAWRGGELLDVDVARLSFVDVRGLGMLAGLCREGWVRLTTVPPHMRRLARLLDLEGQMLGSRPH
ncbi:STAS domain-containing protein [Thermoactinospora rubra]|uniref:STAS domain-containing protein n=1 Tax=Thermoactinospora rubra TaxID=1088767 RepID=UPI0019818D5A|nr:STAS domain-containing protein [Thermoactinospora rubra]